MASAVEQVLAQMKQNSQRNFENLTEKAQKDVQSNFTLLDEGFDDGEDSDLLFSGLNKSFQEGTDAQSFGF